MDASSSQAGTVNAGGQGPVPRQSGLGPDARLAEFVAKDPRMAGCVVRLEGVPDPAPPDPA